MKLSGPFLFILATLLIDAIGIGIVFPIMPDLMDRVGAGSTAAGAFWGGVMMSAYAAAMFLFGPIIGAMIFWFLKEALETTLRQVAEIDSLPNLITDFVDGSEGAISIATVGLSLMLLMAFRPQGIFGDRTQMVLEVRR